MSNIFKASEYMQTLSTQDQIRYTHKLKTLNIGCPYELNEVLWTSGRECLNVVPPITLDDIFFYFLNSKNSTTAEASDAYKDIVAAMNRSVDDGWISDFKSKRLPSKVVLFKAIVTPSQTINNKYVPWAAAQPSGTILFAHCTCPAGYLCFINQVFLKVTFLL